MHATPDMTRAAGARTRRPAGPRRHEAGVSIVLAMLVLFVLVVVLFQVRFTASVELDQAVSFVNSARMGMLADAAFQQAQTQLLLDVDQPEEDAGGDGGSGADDAGGGPEAPGGDGGGADTGGSEDGGGSAFGGGDEGDSVGDSEEQASIADTMASTDSLLDEWQESSALAPALGQDYTMFVEVEDEDSKVNLLGLWNPDEEVADRQREVVRVLLDKAFEGTSRDLSYIDCNDMLDNLDDWVAGNRGSFDPVPVPKLKKTNQEEEETEGELDTTVLDEAANNFPLTLGELADIEGFTGERLSGFVEDDVFYPGLERYLTLFSNLELKPEPPATEDPFGGSPFTEGSLFDKPPAGSSPPAAGDGGDTGEGEEGSGSSDEEESFDPTNDGLVNANTAPLVVLRALAPEDIPTSFLEKIVEYRQEIVRLQSEGALTDSGGSLFDDAPGTSGEDSEGEDDGSSDSSDSSGGLGDDDEDENIVDYVFTTGEEVVDKVEEKYKFSLNLDPGIKEDFTTLLTTTSNVFTIKILILDTVTKRRASYRGMVWRMTGGDSPPSVVTIMPLEPAYDPRRLKDFPEDLSDSSEARFSYAADKLRKEQQDLLH
jgi:hypothetical protein